MQYQYAGSNSTQWQSGSSGSSGGSGGIGFLGLLQVALIVLKLLGKIDWSWWLVWAPTWGASLLIVAVVVGVVLFRKWVSGDFKKKKEK